MLDDTIAAIATPLGEGGIAVIRVSGPDALTVADRCFRPAGRDSVAPSQAPSHTIHYGHIVKDEAKIDEVLLSVLRAPRTFTREDVVEISCHGGVLVARETLAAVLGQGCRLAEPGEFTRRAFLNGRIDLAQAEAVLDVIHASAKTALRAAQEQLEGKLSQRVHKLRDDLMLVLAHVEAHIDFPDEDIAPDTRDALLRRLRAAGALVQHLIRAGQDGLILRRGIRAAIVGPPNAGKSSLLNQLLGRERAIVSPQPGTTRDTIEETASVRGIPVVFIDTAGLRDGSDEIEREGIRRTESALDRADLILHVLDGSEPVSSREAKRLEELADRKRVIVQNKCDLPPRLELSPDLETVRVSCVTGEGLESLRDRVKSMVWSGQVQPDMIEAMLNARHIDALRRASQAIDASIVSIERGDPLELTAVELRLAASAVGEIVGKTATEDLLDAIFSQFCIGK
jgi:tRNA modification GTPase